MTDEQMKILDTLILRYNSLDELSYHLRVAVFTINRWMLGKTKPSNVSLAKMRALHDINIPKKGSFK